MAYSNQSYHHYHHAVCRTTGALPLPKRVIQTQQSSASFFKFQDILVSLRSSSSCLCLLPRLPGHFIFLSTFPSMTYFRRQFLGKMRPIQLSLLSHILCRIFLSSLILCNTSSFLTRSVQLTSSILVQHHI
jgi:hypothetical protein